MITKDTVTRLKVKYGINSKILLENVISKIRTKNIEGNDILISPVQEIGDGSIRAQSKAAEIEDLSVFNYNSLSMANKTRFVIGISGGKDSTVAAVLFQHIFGKDRVYGVSMNRSSDIVNRDESLAIKEKYFDNDHWIESPISNEMIKYFIPVNLPDDIENYESENLLSSNGFLRNLFARIRMCKLYVIAQNYVPHGRVVNTSNRSESYVGWSTKWGDNVGDVFPLSDLTAHEVVMIGEELGIPDELLYKQPKDGMTGSTDEDSLGISYETLDDYLISNGNHLFIEENEDGTLKKDALQKIKILHENSRHKIFKLN